MHFTYTYKLFIKWCTFKLPTLLNGLTTFSGMTKKCLVVPRRGCVLKSSELGLGMEVGKSATDGNVFFICNRISATCSSVDLGRLWV